MKKSKIKIVSGMLLSAILLFSFTGCGKQQTESVETTTKEETATADVTAANTEEKIVLNIGDFQAYPTTAHTIIAEKNGYFEEEFGKDNIEVNIHRFLNGPAVNEAFASDAIDVGPVGEQPLLAGIANTKAGTIIAIGERAYGTFGVFVKAGSDIKSIEDLKGKKIGVAIGTNSQKIFNEFLSEAGLTEDDVELVNIPTPADALSSVLSGDVDATPNATLSVWNSYSSGEVVAIKTNEEVPNYVGYEVRTEYLEKHPDIVVRYLKVLNRAYEWEQTHIDEASQILAEVTGLSADAAKELLPKCDLNIDISDEDVAALEKTYKFLNERDLIPEDFEVKDYLDSTYVKQALGK